MSSSDDSSKASGCGALIIVGAIIWFWEYILGTVLGILLLVLIWFLFFGKGAKVRKIKKHVGMIEGAQWMMTRAAAIESYLRATSEDFAKVDEVRVLDNVHRRLGFTPEEIRRAGSKE